MILSINPGSSSLKYKLFRHDLIETKNGAFNIGRDGIKSNKDAVTKMIEQISSRELSEIKQICVRVVHGGNRFLKPTLISNDVLAEIQKFSHLAPLHNPPALETIKVLQGKLKKINIYAIFDTSFFVLLPEVSSVYPIPYKYTNKEKIRRYGFHGISHQYVLDEVDPGHKNKVISIHLGAGSSITAIDRGRVVDTSMGFTPNEGLVMVSRSGDLDPGLVLSMVKKNGYEKTKEIIEKKSGLFGLTGIPKSIYDILMAAGEKVSDKDYVCNKQFSSEEKIRARFAITLFITRIKKYIGAYSAIMGGVDIIAFTGKAAFYSKYIRNETLKNLSFLNYKIVENIETNEELAMAKEVINLGI